LSATRPFDSSSSIKGPWSPCIYLAPLWRYGASNVGCTDVDTQRKKEEEKEKRKGEKKKRESGIGKRRKRKKR